MLHITFDYKLCVCAAADMCHFLLQLKVKWNRQQNTTEPNRTQLAMSSENLWEMHVNVRQQQQQQQQLEHTTAATVVAATTTTTTITRATFVVNFQRHRKCFLQHNKNKQTEIWKVLHTHTRTHTVNYLCTACCHFACACNNIWPKNSWPKRYSLQPKKDSAHSN